MVKWIFASAFLILTTTSTRAIVTDTSPLLYSISSQETGYFLYNDGTEQDGQNITTTASGGQGNVNTTVRFSITVCMPAKWSWMTGGDPQSSNVPFFGIRRWLPYNQRQFFEPVRLSAATASKSTSICFNLICHWISVSIGGCGPNPHLVLDAILLEIGEDCTSYLDVSLHVVGCIWVPDNICA